MWRELLKVVVIATNIFSKWNLQFAKQFFLLPEAFCGLKHAENAIAAGAPGYIYQSYQKRTKMFANPLYNKQD